jgi:hypothetical protein
LICYYRQRRIGFVVTYIVLWKLISKLSISILEPDLKVKACKKASEAVFTSMEKSEEGLERLNYLRVWMQRRRKADFPGPPPRACAAETFPMTIGYPNFRHVWEKTGVAIELGNALTGRIASE